MAVLESKYDLNVSTWDVCDNLWLFGDYFVDHWICSHPPPERRFRLLVVAAVRAVWDHLTEAESRAAVEEAERHTDRPDPKRLAAASDLAEHVYRRVGEPWNANDPVKCLAKAAASVAWLASTEDPFNTDESGVPFWVEVLADLESRHFTGRSPAEAAAHNLRLFRDIFTNPFRPLPAIDPTWLAWNGRTVAKLAEDIYDQKRFEDLPILADALEDAGCADAALLEHLRGPGLHVRGCWAIDLLLGRE